MPPPWLRARRMRAPHLTAGRGPIGAGRSGRRNWGRRRAGSVSTRGRPRLLRPTGRSGSAFRPCIGLPTTCRLGHRRVRGGLRHTGLPNTRPAGTHLNAEGAGAQAAVFDLPFFKHTLRTGERRMCSSLRTCACASLRKRVRMHEITLCAHASTPHAHAASSL